MGFNFAAIVIPADGLPEDWDAACAAVWTQASSTLCGGLGKIYTRFEIATRPWEQDVHNPYGVILGRSDPQLLLRLYDAGKFARQKSMEYHTRSMLLGIDFENGPKLGDTIFCMVSPENCSPLTLGHALWQMSLERGDILPDCGIYYAHLKSALASEEADRDVLAHPDRYALSMVALHWEGAK